MSNLFQFYWLFCGEIRVADIAFFFPIERVGFTLLDSEVKFGLVELSVGLHVFSTTLIDGMMSARMNIVLSRINEVQV